MNLVIDIGNSRIKVAQYNGRDLVEKFVFATNDELYFFLADQTPDHALVCSVKNGAEEILSKINTQGKKHHLTAASELPISIAYATPKTLGVDRIAAVCGVARLFPKQNSLVIDAGTCITYEFLDAHGVYHGGGISPGVNMRFEAMHKLTAKLPLVKPVVDAPLVGASTESAMQSGVMNGIQEEIKGIISRYREKHQELQVVMCGGDSVFFENIVKPSIFVAPDLVLTGLNEILLHHVPK